MEIKLGVKIIQDEKKKFKGRDVIDMSYQFEWQPQQPMKKGGGNSDTSSHHTQHVYTKLRSFT